MVNCELLLDADETVTLPPDAVIVEGSVSTLPTSTLPNPSVEGEMLSCPTAVDPEPVSGTVSAGPGTQILPSLIPEAFAVKVTFSVTLCPPASFTGNAGDVTETPCPVISNDVKVSDTVSVFVSTTGN